MALGTRPETVCNVVQESKDGGRKNGNKGFKDVSEEQEN